MSALDGQLRLGVLTYDLQPFANALLERLDKAIVDLKLTAYPCFHHPAQADASVNVLKSSILAKPFGVSGRGVQEAFTSSLNWRAAWRIAADNDIVMLYGLQGLTALLAGFFSVIRGKPIISVNHSLAPEMEKRRRWWIRFLKRLLLRACDEHICQMPAAERTLVEVYGVTRDRLSIANFEGGAALYRPMTENRDQRRLATRKRLSIQSGETLYLFVGNVIPLKGPELFVRALARLNSFPIRGILAGPEEPGYGPVGTIRYYQELAKSLAIADRVHLTGRLDVEGLADLYAAADVLVLPTFKDCMPKVFIEAALFGLPIVTTTAPGSVGVLPDPGRNGFAVSIGNLDELADAMKILLQGERRAEFSKAALDAVDAFCDPEKETIGFVSAINKTRSRFSNKK